MVRFFSIAILLSLIFVSCNKVRKYSNTPDIQFIQFSIDSTKQFVGDNVILACSYTDGDGDIGIAENAGNVKLTDSRDSSVYSYGFPKIDAQYITTKGVSGTFFITILSAGLTLKNQTKEREKFVYFVEVTDKAGNISNKVVTDSFTVYK